MTDRAPFTAALLRLVDAVRELSGGQLVWKDIDPGLRDAQGERVGYQRHRACLAVKRDVEARAQCIAWCGVPGRRHCGHGHCHAGFQQWRWPVRDTGGVIGYACFGPFAAGGAVDVPSPPSSARAEAVRALVTSAIAGLAAARACERDALGAHARHPCLRALLEHLRAAPRHDEHAADLARQVHISPSRLQHLCREELGTSLRAVCDRYLLQHARALLRDPARLAVKQVAARLGFRDHRAFVTWFGRHVGVSPGRWRSSHAV